MPNTITAPAGFSFDPNDGRLYYTQPNGRLAYIYLRDIPGVSGTTANERRESGQQLLQSQYGIDVNSLPPANPADMERLAFSKNGTNASGMPNFDQLNVSQLPVLKSQPTQAISETYNTDPAIQGFKNPNAGFQATGSTAGFTAAPSPTPAGVQALPDGGGAKQPARLWDPTTPLPKTANAIGNELSPGYGATPAAMAQMQDPATGLPYKNPNVAFQATGDPTTFGQYSTDNTTVPKPSAPVDTNYFVKQGESPEQYSARIAGYNQTKTATVSPAPVGSITSASLTPGTTPEFKTVTPSNPYPVTGLDATPPMVATPQEDKASAVSTRLQELNQSLVGQSAYRGEQEQAQGIPGLQKSQQDLAARLKALQNEATAIPMQLQLDSEGRGITGAGLRPIEAAALRKNAIAALTTSSMLEASRGNLTLALDLVERAVAQKFDPIKEQIAVAKDNLDLIINDPKTSLEDKNRALKQKEIQDAKERAINQQESNQQNVLKIAADAAANGADALTLDRISKATNPIQALEIASASGVYQKAQESPTPSLTGKIGSLTQAVISNPSLFYNFTPTQKGQVVAELQGSGYDISGLQNSKLTAGQQDDIAQMNTVSNLINDILAYGKSGSLPGVGAFGAGTLMSLGAQLGFGSDEGQQVRALIGNIKGTIAKLRGGTSFTTNEEKLLNTYTPAINDSSEVALNKLRLLQDFIVQKNTDLLNAAQQNITLGQIKKTNSGFTGSTSSGLQYTVVND